MKQWGSVGRWLLLLMMFIINGVGIVAQDNPNQPPPPGGECRPLDVILVMDRSASMEGEGDVPSISAARAVFQSLYFNAAIDCENIVTHRVAVVGFNSETSQLLDIQIIFFEDGGSEDWFSELENTQNQVRSGNVESQTSFFQAFFDDDASVQSVIEALDRQAEALGYGDVPERRKIVIVMTDGYPCTELGNCGDGGWVRHYFFAGSETQAVFPTRDEDDLEALGFEPDLGFEVGRGLVGAIDDAFDEDIYIGVLHFMDPRNPPEFDGTDEAWQEIVRNRGGEYVFIPVTGNNFSGIVERIEKIFEPLLGQDTTPLACNDTFWVEPYQSSTAIISAIRPNVSSAMILTDPTGLEISGENFEQLRRDAIISGEYLNEETIERFLLESPAPGEWTFSGDPLLCEQIEEPGKVRFAPIDAEIQDIPDVIVNINEDENYIAPNDTARIRIDITDQRANQPFAEIPSYPLTITATVTGPLGAPIADLPRIQFRNEAPGVWVSTTGLPAPRQGEYRVRITAEVQSLETGEPLEVFSLPNLGDGEDAPPPPQNGDAGAPPPDTGRDNPQDYIYQTRPPVHVGFAPRVLGAVAQSNPPLVSLNDLSASGEQQPRTVDVQVRVTPNDNGVPQEMASIFPNVDSYDGLVEATISGNGITETIGLTGNPNDPFGLIGTFREGQTQLDPTGEYNIAVRLTNDGVDAYNTQNYCFASRNAPPPEQELRLQDRPPCPNESERSTVMRRQEISGVLLADNGTPTQVKRSFFEDDGTETKVPIEIRTRLVNQDGEPLNYLEVFGNVNPDLLVEAKMFPLGDSMMQQDPLQTIFLRWVGGTPGDFVGQFDAFDILDENGNPEGVVGNHNFQLSIPVDIPTDNATDYGLVNDETTPLELQVSRVPSFAVKVIAAASSPDNGEIVDLNIVTDDGEVIPRPVEVTAVLANQFDNPYSAMAVTTDVLPNTDLNNIIEATLTAQGVGQNITETAWMTFDDETGEFEATFRTGIDIPDPEGTYNVTFNVRDGVFPTAAEAEDASDDTYIMNDMDDEAVSEFYRRRVVGISLELVRVAGIGEPRPNFSVPMYTTAGEAFCSPNPTQECPPAPVEFVFVLRDTEDTVRRWEDLLDANYADIINGVVPTDADAPSDDDADDASETDEATEEPAANQTSAPPVDLARTRDTILNSLVRRQLSSPEFFATLDGTEVGNLTADGDQLILTIDEPIRDNDNYDLSYALDGSTFDDAWVVNLTPLDTQLPFVREAAQWYQFWLNPLFWNLVKWLIIVTVVYLVINLVLINTIHRMSGYVQIRYGFDDVSSDKHEISLGGFKLFRNSVSETVQFNRGDGIKTVHVRVRRHLYPLLGSVGGQMKYDFFAKEDDGQREQALLTESGENSFDDSIGFGSDFWAKHIGSGNADFNSDYDYS